VPEQVEGVQNRVAFTVEQLIELTHAAGIEANDLGVEDGTLSRQARQSFLQVWEAEVALVARDELRLAVLQIHHDPEAIVLQLEDVVGIVERLFQVPEPHRLDTRQHGSMTVHPERPRARFCRCRGPTQS